MKRLITTLIVCIVALRVHAESVSVSQASATFTVNTEQTEMNYSWTIAKTEGVSYGQVSCHEVDGLGAVIGGNKWLKDAINHPLSGSGVFTGMDPTKRYRVRAAKLNWSNALIEEDIKYIEPLSDYSVTVYIPANNTNRLIRYELWQNGAYLGAGFSVTTSPGDSQVIKQFTDLPSDDPVELREVTSNLVYNEETGDFSFGESSYVRTVATGTPTLVPASLPSAGTTSPTATAGGKPPVPSVLPTPPATPTPEQPAPSPTTPTPAPTNVTPMPTVVPSFKPTAPSAPSNPTPTGTDPVTKADLTTDINRVVDVIATQTTANNANTAAVIDAVDTVTGTITTAADKAISNANQNTEKIVSASNAQVTAIDKVTGQVVATGNQVVSAIQAQGTVAHADANAILSAIGASSAENRADREREAAERAAWSASNSANWTATGAGKNTEAQGVITSGYGGTGVTLGESGTPGTGASMDITIGGETYDVAPWANPLVSKGAAILRIMIGAYLAFSYFVWVYETMQKGMTMVLHTPQAKGNTVAGTGGQITALTAAAVITGIILSVPAAVAVYVDAGGTLGFKSNVSLLGGITAIDSQIGGWVIDLLFMFLPMTTIGAIMTGKLAVLIALLTVGMGASVAIKWIVPALAVLLYLSSPVRTEAAVRVLNESGNPVDIHDYNNVYIATIPANTDTTFQEQGVPVYIIRQGFFGGEMRECLDKGTIVIANSSQVTVVHRPEAFIAYFMWGFSVGMVFELAGLGYRLFLRLSASGESL